MPVYCFAFLAFLSCVSAAPRDRWSSFFGPSAFTYGGFAPRSFTGAYSGFGFPFYQPMPWMPFPMPDMSQFFTEWYKGPNVCKVDKVIEEPDEIRQFMSEGGPSQGPNFDFNHESESCRGDNNVYVCMKWIQTPKGTNIQMTKYSCCHGYSRPADGSPGCVENDGDESGTTEEPKALPKKDQYRYSFYQGNSGSSAVAKVPAQ